MELADTRKLTTEEKLALMVSDDDAMDTVYVDDKAELTTLKSALAEHRYQDPVVRWNRGEMMLSAGIQSVSREQLERFHAAQASLDDDEMSCPVCDGPTSVAGEPCSERCERRQRGY